MWRRLFLRFARHMTASLIASLLLRCIPRVPEAPSVPSLRSSQDGVAHCFASRRRRSLLRFSCVANDVCLWRRRSLRFARDMTASLMASLLMRCKRRMPVAPSVPSHRSSHDGIAHCFASLRCNRRVPVAPSVPSLRSSHGGSLTASLLCVANGVCLWCRRSRRFARHMTASLIASLLLRCNRRVPVAPSVPSLRSSHGGVAHCFAALALQTACACGAVGPFASLVT